VIRPGGPVLWRPYELSNTVGYPLDSTLMAAHLMASGALDATPGLAAEEKAQICGGTTKMLLGEE